MATVRPLGCDVAPVRVSIERALALSALGVVALALAAPAVAGERYQFCSDAERAKYIPFKQPVLRPIELPRPEYSRWPHEVHAGVVYVLLTLRADGHTSRICVLRASPPDAFEQIAVDLVRQWRYAPKDVARLPAKDRRFSVEVSFEPGDR